MLGGDGTGNPADYGTQGGCLRPACATGTAVPFYILNALCAAFIVGSIAGFVRLMRRWRIISF
jgi:hypothetical protein